MWSGCGQDASSQELIGKGKHLGVQNNFVLNQKEKTQIFEIFQERYFARKDTE